MVSANEELRLNGGVIPDYLINTNIPRVSVGIVAPTGAPNKIGDIYINAALYKVYIAVSLSKISGWLEISNAG